MYQLRLGTFCLIFVSPACQELVVAVHYMAASASSIIVVQVVCTHIEFRICNISSYDWDVAARLLTSGLVMLKLLFAFTRESLRR